MKIFKILNAFRDMGATPCQLAKELVILMLSSRYRREWSQTIYYPNKKAA